MGGLAISCGDNLPEVERVCAPTETDCDGACRRLPSDPANCGACGVACGVGQVCSAGTCESTCAAGTAACDGACLDLANDVDHCGACGTACRTDDGTASCIAGVCGIASCDAGFFANNGACVLCADACAAGQFESVACSTATDRACTTCAAIAGCSSVTCTSSTDAVCNTCEAGQYWSGTACEACTTDACPTGTYEAVACTATADRSCGACTAIAGCTAASCTTAADETCLACDAGLYLSGGACVACTPCGAGEFEATACTATADRTCEACTTDACPIGTYEAVACTATTDRSCAACTAIAGCPAASCTTAADETCLACDAGLYLSGGGCVACTSCGAGEFEATACTATADRTCEACTTDACPTGTYVAAACTATADRSCGACTAIAGCAAESCTTAADETCLACDAGRYLSGGACVACTPCGAGESEQTACTATADRTCAVLDCYTLRVGNPLVGNGVYVIDPDGAGGEPAFAAYCDMTSNGGGWTLLMKVNGALSTFTYQAALWTNTVSYQPDQVALDVVNETKSPGFATMPFTALRVGMFDATDGVTRWLEVPHADDSLFALFTGGFQALALGRDAWKGLLASPSLQYNCNREGFNVVSGGGTNTRIGIIGNQENNCDSPDSRIGIGTEGDFCGQNPSHAAGNEARCQSDAGDRATVAFGYVMVRNCPGGICDCGTLASCDALCVDTATDIENCGACATTCAAQPNALPTCVTGSCQVTCNPGFDECDLNAATGCETYVSRNDANCGACGNACTAGLTCRNSACLAPTALQIVNPNGALVEYLPRNWGGQSDSAEGSCSTDCTVHPTVGEYGVRVRSSTGFASGCDDVNRRGECYVTLPARVVVN
ncbi:MAG: hypothetical protein M3680_19915 [Myxococcota bacterium]|nr:hypothetical protein [Myxococcota bacterium]